MVAGAQPAEQLSSAGVDFVTVARTECAAHAA